MALIKIPDNLPTTSILATGCPQDCSTCISHTCSCESTGDICPLNCQSHCSSHCASHCASDCASDCDDSPVYYSLIIYTFLNSYTKVYDSASASWPSGTSKTVRQWLTLYEDDYGLLIPEGDVDIVGIDDQQGTLSTPVKMTKNRGIAVYYTYVDPGESVEVWLNTTGDATGWKKTTPYIKTSNSDSSTGWSPAQPDIYIDKWHI